MLRQLQLLGQTSPALGSRSAVWPYSHLNVRTPKRKIHSFGLRDGEYVSLFLDAGAIRPLSATILANPHKSNCEPLVLSEANTWQDSNRSRAMAAVVKVVPRDLHQRRGVVDSVAIDRAARIALARADPLEPILLDLRKALYIDHDALLLLGALVEEHAARGQDIQLALPTQRSVLDFLIAWKFHELCRELGGAQQVFTPNSVDLIRERLDSTDRKYRSFVSGPDGRPIPASILDSLAIEEVRLTDDEIGDAYRATRRYAYRHFQAVLVRWLGKPAGSQFFDAVWECVRNASSHPVARRAYASTHFRRRLSDAPEELQDPERPTHELQFAIWDDGQPVWQTLKGAIDGGLSVKSERYGEEGVTFRVRVEKIQGGLDELVVLSDSNDPAEDVAWRSERHLLTCAAFMLGISSDPSRTRRDPGATGDSGGVGLAIVRRTALTTTYGRVEYRSGTMRLAVRRSFQDSPQEYDVTVRLAPEEAWSTRGNLFTVTMPMTKSVERR